MTSGPTLVDVTDSRTRPVAARAGSGTSRSVPWAVAPGATDDVIRVRRRRWYGGAIFALLWQVLEIAAVWSDGRSFDAHVWSTVALFVLYAVYLVVPELMWRRTLRRRLVVLGGVALLAGLMLFIVGPLAVWSWILVVTLAGFVAQRRWIAVASVAVIVGAQFLVAAVSGWEHAVQHGLLFAPVVTLSVGASMLFFGRQREAEDRLGVAHDELTRLAVVEERARFSRDLHDVLGHSLTVVAIKSELASRLVDLDPERAKAEMREVEQLSRDALQGLRQAVSGYREADLDAELVAARAALAAAGIDADLPVDGAAPASDVRSLFAWVVREGTTNVIRHASATRVRITLHRTAVTIEDDGTGVSASGAAVAGNGLRGLRERADALGATVTTGTSDLGGFLLRVERGGRR
ncbi:hypothetical protein MMM2322_00882 [Microbacterium sp. MM2322]